MDGRKDRIWGGDIAIVGMSACLPGASSTTKFWDNLKSGVESIVELDATALRDAGERAERLNDPNYVPAAAPLKEFDHFDAEFFGFSPRDAAIMDPQHRKFLECAWTAMEDAGHTPETMNGSVGVFAGCGMGSYFYFNICSNPDLVDDVGMFLLRHTGNDKDFLSTRVSHIFDLKGPSINVQTACSTSLVAVHYACRALQQGDCDMALAGGVTIELPQGRGYLFKENEILSPDGHCHAFDHRAQGTVFGSGAGVVALRRLEDAQADGDHIWAVIKGTAINNDGAAKAGYLAPSVEGQAEAVTRALEVANVTADTIDYVECHGTGTYLGDPIEVSALSQAYRATTQERGYCRIGSVKTNIGHLDTAAGVASLIKTTLGLHHRHIPKSLGYEAPNPAIDFEASPFRVNDQLSDWTSFRGPRRGAVNSLGVGGTNAHVILEEAPERPASEESDFPFHVLCVSGHTKSARDANAKALADYLRAHPDINLADVAYTLQEGRRGFDSRLVVVAETPKQAADLLESKDSRLAPTHDCLSRDADVVFMFPGGGAQFVGMAQDLYETEPVFAEWMDRGLDHLQPRLDHDLRQIWLPQDSAAEIEAEALLQKPSVQLPLIMIVEFALARLWQSWGVQPSALVGHSMGENTAACLAGVLSFEDCIDLVLLRGRLFDTVPAGGMLSIMLPVAQVRELIGDDLDIASVNAPNLTAVSGPQDKLDQLSELLTGRDIEHQRIQIDIAAHSRMLDPILEQFGDFLRGLDLKAPTIPIISNRTGEELTADQATDPDYWVGQLRNTVLFADCLNQLARPDRVFLEVGPGKALSSLAQSCDGINRNQTLSSLRHPDHQIADDAYFLRVIGQLWACGIEADWPQIWGEARRNRLPLPGYAYQRSRYFIEPGQPATQAPDLSFEHIDDLSNWGWQPVWRPRLAECDIDVETELEHVKPLNWLIFEDAETIAASACAKLANANHQVIHVRAGDTFARLSDNLYQLPPEQGKSGYTLLLDDLAQRQLIPDRIGHFWLAGTKEQFRPGSNLHERNVEQGLFSLTALAQAISSAGITKDIHVCVFTTGAVQVSDEALSYPEKAMIAGPMGVIHKECPGITCASVDIDLSAPTTKGIWARLSSGDPGALPDMSARLLQELLATPANTAAAWRGEKRLGKEWKPVPLDRNDPVFRKGGTYLITGGFGGIGLTIAADLMAEQAANVILLSRTPLPAREDWDRYLKAHSPKDNNAGRIRALLKLEAIGSGQVLAASADVCNIEQMRTALGAAEARFGAITGVIHAAGQIDDAPLLGKTEADIRQVLAPKIDGLRVLDQIFPDGMLEDMILFSSSSTATCPAGQLDYIAANEYLNAWARSRVNAATRVRSINWGVWAQVGMAANAMSDRLSTDTVVMDQPTAQPMLDTAGFDVKGNRLFRSTFRAHWVFDEHRTADGQALMPGTGFLELAAQAMAAQGYDTPFEIQDLLFLRPMFDSDAERGVLLRLYPDGDALALGIYSQSGGGYLQHAQATLKPHLSAQPPLVDLSAIAGRCGSAEIIDENAPQTPQEAHLKFGPRWRVLQNRAFGDTEGLAELSLPTTFTTDLKAGFILHPGLMDLATGWAIGLAPGYESDSLWVPVSYGSVRLYRPIPAQIRSWVRLVQQDDTGTDHACFDATLTDTDGNVCAEIRAFKMQKLVTAIAAHSQQEADTSPAELGLEARANQAAISADERRLHQSIAQGIRPEEGPEALRRALNLGAPQVLVSALDLPMLFQQVDRSAAQAAKDVQTFDRPTLDTDYIAPRSPTEDTIAGFFQTLLGVAQVGVEDSFFDLGGHSLIAVRLFAQINREFGVDFPMSLLFEAPSVAAIAARIGENTAGAADPETQTDQPRSYTHLVTLHAAEHARSTPVFIVAGMFGNVLNLRHLGLMLGPERSVYGLQARGLVGDEPPHYRLEEAAADYIAEIRQVQPHGPYYLSGFSGGGITAYEIAQQLRSAGEDVAVLAMLDTPLPVRPELSTIDKAWIKLHELKRKGPSYLAEWMQNRIAWEVQKRKAPAPANLANAFNNAEIEAAFREAVGVYQLRHWDGPLTVFRPPLDRHWPVSGGKWVSAQREYVLDDNGWTDWAAQTQVIEVPGDHDSMVLVPNVSVLAEKLRKVIAEAECTRGLASAAE